MSLLGQRLKVKWPWWLAVMSNTTGIIEALRKYDHPKNRLYQESFYNSCLKHYIPFIVYCDKAIDIESCGGCMPNTFLGINKYVHV